jgi:LmbE family N-acetylglucosaminyl deacetylase
VTATSGDFAETDAARADARHTREAELAAALDALGVVDRVLLGHPDGGCAAVDPEAPIGEIAAVIADRSPATIVTFGAEGVTGHPDHRAVWRWTTEAARRALPGARVLHPATTADRVAAEADISSRFDIYEPGLPRVHRRDELALELVHDGAVLDAKVRALRAHASQTAGLIAALGERRFRDWVSVEAFVDAPHRQIPTTSSTTPRRDNP